MTDLRAAIQQELERRGWSRYQLAEALRDVVPVRTVYAYLAGERDIRGETIGAMLAALGLEVRALRRPRA